MSLGVVGRMFWTICLYDHDHLELSGTQHGTAEHKIFDGFGSDRFYELKDPSFQIGGCQSCKPQSTHPKSIHL